jgi:hypothetical protein
MPSTFQGRDSEHELSRFERLLSMLSALFIDLPSKQFDPAIDDSLARIVATLDIDWSTLSCIVPLTGRAEVSHWVGARNVPPLPASPSGQGASAWALSMAMAAAACIDLAGPDQHAGQDGRHGGAHGFVAASGGQRVAVRIHPLSLAGPASAPT